MELRFRNLKKLRRGSAAHFLWSSPNLLCNNNYIFRVSIIILSFQILFSSSDSELFPQKIFKKQEAFPFLLLLWLLHSLNAFLLFFLFYCGVKMMVIG